MGEILELTEREAKEIAFALHYANSYAHGTDGHSRLMLIAKLATFIDIARPIGSVRVEGEAINIKKGQ